MELQDAVSSTMVLGQVVRIRGLVGAVELNGMVGTIISEEANGRVGVAINSIGNKSIKVANCCS